MSAQSLSEKLSKETCICEKICILRNSCTKKYNFSLHSVKKDMCVGKHIRLVCGESETEKRGSDVRVYV